MSGNTSAVLSPPVSLCTDFKAGITDRIEPRSFEALDETARRFFGFESQQEFFERRARTFNFDQDALWRIVDPAGKFKFGREAEEEGTEADALHRATNGDLQTGFPGSRSGTGCFHSPLQYYTQFSPALNQGCQSLHRNCQKKVCAMSD